jgi:hypothetical protein
MMTLASLSESDEGSTGADCGGDGGREGVSIYYFIYMSGGTNGDNMIFAKESQTNRRGGNGLRPTISAGLIPSCASPQRWKRVLPITSGLWRK